jgi:aryl-phospho-beta-D-glucosidase BglC (GH1 family)
MTFQNRCLAGVNLGGWLSQYQRLDHEHFRTFITETDIQQIAGWGMDHVRLPIDYPVLEDDARPGVYQEDGFAYIDRCVEWCTAAGLKIILDVHQAPGYKFDALDRVTLFDDAALQQRLIELWCAIARRYRGEGDNLYLELLNEIVLPSSDPWSELATRGLTAIRAVDPQRVIIIGGNNYNAVDQMDRLRLPPDDRLVYTFHFYEPLIFTHQKAPWVPETFEYGQTVIYPAPSPDLTDFLAQKPQHRTRLERFLGKQLDRDLLRAALQPAFDFARASGYSIYCGEFGVIDRAPQESNRNWHRDFIDLLREQNIGRACWSYKLMDFGLVDANSRVIDPELVKIVSTP